MSNNRITFKNGLSFEIDVSGKVFNGIGAVSFRGEKLRSASVPWTIIFEAEQGFRFDSYELARIEKTGDSARIFIDGTAGWMPFGRTTDAMGDSRFHTRRLQKPRIRLCLHMETISEKIRENGWTGVKTRWEIVSSEIPLHWAIEDTTWEIGGKADGAVLLQQDVSTIDLEQKVSKDGAFSSIEKFAVEEKGAWGGAFPMDMLPRGAGAPICDFQAKGKTAFCTFFEKPSLTRSRIEKFAGEDVIHYSDNHFFPLSKKAMLPERKILLFQSNKKLMKHEWRNLWLDCFTEARKRILANYGFKPEIPQPSVHAHLWDADLKKRGAGWTNELGEAFAKYAELGYKDVFTHGVWDSVTSDPAEPEGNICCPYSFTFAEKFGGTKGMRKLADKAHGSGIGLFQWFGFQFAKNSPIWKEHPEWLLREQNGTPWDGDYGMLWCGRMRSGFGKMLEQQIRKVKDDTGMDGIFFDSYQNLGITCVDWQGEDKAPQAEEIWRMQSRLQKHGYKFRCEVTTIFGVSQVAMYGFKEDKFRRRLWDTTVENDDAFALIDCSPAFFTDDPFTEKKLSPKLYFWLLGHRAVPGIGARPWTPVGKDDTSRPFLPGKELAEEYAAVNRLYNEALPKMQRLRVTENGDYSLWLDRKNRPSVIWGFRKSEFKFSGKVKDLNSCKVSEVDSVLKILPGHVCVITPEGGGI